MDGFQFVVNKSAKEYFAPKFRWHRFNYVFYICPYDPPFAYYRIDNNSYTETYSLFNWIGLTMKRILVILFIGVSILSLYSFEYADDERYMTFISINKQEFYVLDTINSIYKFCITVSEDSDHVIGREISYGRIKKTDSTFIIYGTECLFARFCISNDKHVKKVLQESYFLIPISTIR